MSHRRVPVLASAVLRLCILYEVINTFNIEVNVGEHLYCLVHLNDPFASVISRSSLLCLLKHKTLG